MSPDEAYGPGASETVARERLKDHLLSRAAELEGIVAFAERQQDPDPEGPARWLYEVRSALPSETPREVLRRWRDVFADELEIVRLARNNVAHAKYISDENLRNAVTIADRLIRIAKSSVGEAGSNSDLGYAAS